MRAFAVVFALLALAGCGGSAPRTATLDPERLRPERLYPMVEGAVWSYDVDTGEAVPTLGITRVLSVRGDRVAISSNGSEAIEYERRPEGLFLVGADAWALRAPIDVGASWPSRSGRTARVTSITESIDTPGGHFDGCVRVEESGGDASVDVETLYCPDVGPVFVRSGMRSELTGETLEVRATLRGYVTPE